MHVRFEKGPIKLNLNPKTCYLFKDQPDLMFFDLKPENVILKKSDLIWSDLTYP